MGIRDAFRWVRDTLTGRRAKLKKGMQNAGREAAQLLLREARRRTPISPTMEQERAAREARRKKPLTPAQEAAYARRRNPRATSRAKPGALTDSVECAPSPDGKRITLNVPGNSMAGSYARKIHDEKGISWRNRGPGTVAKGPLADDKFLHRAAADNLDEVREIYREEIDEALGGR